MIWSPCFSETVTDESGVKPAYESTLKRNWYALPAFNAVVVMTESAMDADLCHDCAQSGAVTKCTDANHHNGRDM